jgi:hypothetical protein
MIGLSLVAVVGCGPAKGSLSGKVTYQGKDLKGGSVSLIPVAGDGQSYSTKINEDGTYSFDQILSGKYKVCVETTSLKGATSGAAAGPTYGGKPASGAKEKSKIKNKLPEGVQPPTEGYRVAEAFGGGTEAASRYVAIPPEFGDPSSTPLTVEVKGGSQTHDITLTGG